MEPDLAAVPPRRPLRRVRPQHVLPVRLHRRQDGQGQEVQHQQPQPGPARVPGHHQHAQEQPQRLFK